MREEAVVRPSLTEKEAHLSSVLSKPCYADTVPLDPRGDRCCDNQGFIAALLREDWSLLVGARDTHGVDPLLDLTVWTNEVYPSGSNLLGDRLRLEEHLRPGLGPRSPSLGFIEPHIGSLHPTGPVGIVEPMRAVLLQAQDAAVFGVTGEQAQNVAHLGETGEPALDAPMQPRLTWALCAGFPKHHHRGLPPPFLAYCRIDYTASACYRSTYCNVDSRLHRLPQDATVGAVDPNPTTHLGLQSCR
jgi:hypothetical protein